MKPTVRKSLLWSYTIQILGIHHLSTRLKVGMGKWARSLQELPHMAPSAMPVTSTVLVCTINGHSTQAAHHNTQDMMRVLGC